MFKRWFSPPSKSYLLLGPRRAGKTTFLKQNYSDYFYITLDDYDCLDLAEKDPKAVLGDHKKLIIDEIQRVPKLTVAVKFAIDENLAHIIMTGSSRIGLLDASADTLAGRIEICNLPPLCWGEKEGEPSHSIFSEQVDSLKLKKAQRQVQQAIKWGGFPEVLQQDNEKQKADILQNYKNTYFTRDLSLLSNIENIPALLAIFYHYAKSIGSLTQISNFRQEANLSHQATQKYINSIYQSELGFKLLGYQHGPAKRQIKASKSYFCDNGIITALKSQCTEGQMLENFVISELEKRRKLGFYKCDQFYYYQSVGGAEVDLIIAEENETKAIEIKNTKKPQKKDVSQLIKFVQDDPKNRKGFLFYMGEEYQKIDIIHCIPIATIYRGR